MIFWAVGRMPVVELDVETVQILLAASRNLRHEFLWRNTRFFSRNHDRRTMRIVSTNKMHFVTRHSLMSHPDVSLDIFHDVTKVEGRVCVGKGSGNEQLTGHVDALFELTDKDIILTANPSLKMLSDTEDASESTKHLIFTIFFGVKAVFLGGVRIDCASAQHNCSSLISIWKLTV